MGISRIIAVITVIFIFLCAIGAFIFFMIYNNKQIGAEVQALKIEKSQLQDKLKDYDVIVLERDELKAQNKTLQLRCDILQQMYDMREIQFQSANASNSAKLAEAERKAKKAQQTAQQEAAQRKAAQQQAAQQQAAQRKAAQQQAAQRKAAQQQAAQRKAAQQQAAQYTRVQANKKQQPAFKRTKWICAACGSVVVRRLDYDSTYSPSIQGCTSGWTKVHIWRIDNTTRN
jgi:flagellar biosynthesis GTPase FlhF